jgi:hypothetical protein
MTFKIIITFIQSINSKVAVGTKIPIADDTKIYFLIAKWRTGPRSRSQMTADPEKDILIKYDWIIQGSRDLANSSGDNLSVP